VYYGRYHFTIIAEGYETLQVDQKIAAPWYQFPGLDFVSENLIPWKIVDRREFSYRLEPRRIPDTNKLLSDGQNLRNRGISLGGGSALPVPGTTPTLPQPRVLPPGTSAPGTTQPPRSVPTPSPSPPGPSPASVPMPPGPIQPPPGTVLNPPASAQNPQPSTPQGF
jgi:hypothetical protein